MDYKIVGEGTKLVFLGGFLDDINNILEIKELFNHQLLIVDYLEKDKINNIFTIRDNLRLIIEKEGFLDAPLVGFSLGGKICFAYALKYLPKKLILIAPSIINLKSPLTKLKIKLYKLNKRFSFPSKEYLNLTNDNLKKSFIHFTNTYFNDNLKNYKGEVLVYYGENDKQTKLKEGRKIHKLLVNSKLVVAYDSDHFTLYEDPYLFIKTLEEFLNA